jgi:hypothetical protein
MTCSKPPRTLAITLSLAALTCLILVGVALPVGASGAYTPQQTQTAVRATNEASACPAGQVQHQVNADGTRDCRPTTTLTNPLDCAWSGGNVEFLSNTGLVSCQLGFGAGLPVVNMVGAVGCLNVNRTPYPRTIVNLRARTQFAINGVIDPGEFSDATSFGGINNGSYVVPVNAPPGRPAYSYPGYTVAGPFIPQRAGIALNHPLDSVSNGVWDTRNLSVAEGFYPSINAVQARLFLFPETTRNSGILAEMYVRPAETFNLQPDGDFEANFTRASHAGQNRAMYGGIIVAPTGGPGPTAGLNNQPGYMVRAESRWNVFLEISWVPYGADANNVYSPAGLRTQVYRVGVTGMARDTVRSFRVWDSQQTSLTNVESVACNAATGYMPVPVIEAQVVGR